MEFPQLNPGAPAVNSTHVPGSDKTTIAMKHPNTTAQHNQAFFLYPTRDYPFAPSRGLSPPQERGYSHVFDKVQALSYNQYFDPAISSDTAPNHRLTPPRQDDEFQQLHRWYAQQRNGNGDHQVSPSYAPAVGYRGPANNQNHARRVIPSPHSRTMDVVSRYRDPVDVHSRGTRGLSNTPGPALLHQSPHLAQGKSNQVFRPQNPYVRRRAQHVENEGSRAHYASIYPDSPSLHGCSAATSQDTRSSQAPAVQQWPTHGLDHRRVKPPRPAAAPSPRRISFGPSPGHDGVTPPDQKMLAKKEALRKKAEEIRRLRGLQPNVNPLKAPRLKSTIARTKKRKSTARASEDDTRAVPPSLRKSRVSGNHPLQIKVLSNPYFLSSALQSGHEQNQPKDTDLDRMDVDVSFPISNSDSEELRIQQPVDWDTLPQDITTNYEDYKWSVTHYSIDPNGAYDFAQSWLEDFFAMNVQSSDYKWHAHSSCGFIKDGTRLSFIALHNASDPFARGMPSTSTTSIGVYGRHWHDHEEIHWKTFAPDIRWLLEWCENQNGITVKQKWRSDMPRASDKRFHRAYWIAATRGPMRGLLNHGTIDDAPHDEGDVDEEFEPDEADLAREWDGGDGVTMEEADEAWQRVLEENEDAGDTEGVRYEHVIIGSSEWD